MNPLDSWGRGIHTAGDRTYSYFRKGSGPAVVVIHELPGIIPEVVELAEEVVDRGFTVVLPHLFGQAGRKATPGYAAATVATVCVNREFTAFALGRTPPIATWLRSLAVELHEELGGPGVGAVGMCFTGGFALAMLAGAPVAAPVVAQPSTPFPLGPKRAADLNLSPADLDSVRDKVVGGCQVLGLRYAGDPAVGQRFDTLRRELGDNFIAVEFPGRKHSTLTLHRQQEGVDRVLDFLTEKLRG
ncbi:dienelactone hydrolase family protein [Nocardioides caldifontis]|uniref:dienelactone hydrolase family protein n=1 Tax=Nocardioides caldifontis TaxID=2588938 RepID=UPI001EEFDF59|nr:dienelactone hydrolase family protein [Nocardioides caldifontis]